MLGIDILRTKPSRIGEWRDAIRRVQAAYQQAHGRTPRILRPRRFTEKMQWRKIFDDNPSFTLLCDKLAVREFITSRVGSDLLTPLLWTGMPDEIPFDRIAPPFALKSTHASGQVIMVGSSEPIDHENLRARAAAWLTLCHGTTYDEPGYKAVPRRLMIERTVTTAAGTEPEEVRLFVFDGRVAVINTVFVEDGRIRNGAFHTPNWQRLNWHFNRELARDFPQPARLADMIQIAERLGEGFDHVRVDIYDGGEQIWIGEVTLYSWSGHARFNPDEADLELGRYWRLQAPLRRALLAVLFRPHRARIMRQVVVKTQPTWRLVVTSPTVFRRLVYGLSRIGLDVRPLARRFRTAILRSYQAETETRFRQVEGDQRGISLELSTVQDQLASLARRGEEDRSDAQAHKVHIDALEGALTRLDQELVESRAEAAAAFARLNQELSESHARAMAALTAREVEILALRTHDAVADKAWRERVSRLETLLIESIPVRLPATTQAVARLPDPAVAIILPTYNRAPVIAEAVASVQAQSFSSWELVIVDDGGSDDTAGALAPYLTDGRIRLLRQSRLGPAAARNHGIAETTAPLIAYIDSDNLWYPNFLVCALGCLATEPEIDLVYGALVTDDHGLDRDRILWSPFDREAILAGNFIDTNVLVHRRRLVAQYGDWDTTLNRLLDWDLVLRYTVDKLPKPIAVIAARYRCSDAQRISDIVPYGPDDIFIRSKWFPPPRPLRRPRVLYLAEPDSQDGEIALETELLCMLAWGVQVALWRCTKAPPYNPQHIPVYNGALVEAIAAERPDIIHVHGLRLGHWQSAILARSDRPVTLRPQGSEVTADSLAAWLLHDWAKSVFVLPHHISQSRLFDPRLIALPAAFDSQQFRPGMPKDRRLVAHAATARPDDDLETFFDVARLLPGYCFVLAVTSRTQAADVEAIQAKRARLHSPADMRIDLARGEVAALLTQAGLYLHTEAPAADGALAGHPVSVIEAMACGCYCLVPDSPALALLVGDAGATYRDIDELAALIRDTEQWSEEIWEQSRHRAITRAWMGHADRIVFRPLFDAWMTLSSTPSLLGQNADS